MLLNYIKSEWEQGNLKVRAVDIDGVPSVDIAQYCRRVLLTEWAIKMLSENDRRALHEMAVEKEQNQREEGRVAFDKRHNLAQAEQEEWFSNNRPKSVCINIWDDYDEDSDGTYAYVEESTPDSFNKLCLTYVMEHIQSRYLDTVLKDCELSLTFYDSANVYPSLLGTEHDYCLYKRWQLQFSHLPCEARQALVEKLNTDQLVFDGITINIISES